MRSYFIREVHCTQRWRRVLTLQMCSIALVAVSPLVHASGRQLSAPFPAEPLQASYCETDQAKGRRTLEVRIAELQTGPARDSKRSSLRKSRVRKRKNVEPEETKPRDFRSKYFLLHTDLPIDRAKELLSSLETMLALISRYWGRPNRQTIECFVVKDLKKWPEGSLTVEGLRSIRRGGGLTQSMVYSQAGKITRATAVVYAIAERGTPQHESVHAYSILNFGRAGPVWYSEGMAEMGKYWTTENSKAVNCHPSVVQYIHASEPKSLNAIVNSNEATGDSWQNYAWRWALCHLLATNPNYDKRFRPLGLALLTDQRSVSFESVYGSMAPEISFEYLFFLKHFDRGYRCDLCAWDWKAKFSRPRGKGSMLTKINAERGWQPARLRVKQDQEYEFSAEGTWQTSPAGTPVAADGDTDGSGRLVGVVFDNYKLSQSFDLGAFGSFTAPANGNLYLRCNDAWHEIEGNKGRLSVRLKVKGVGKALTPPKSQSSRS